MLIVYFYKKKCLYLKREVMDNINKFYLIRFLKVLKYIVTFLLGMLTNSAC